MNIKSGLALIVSLLAITTGMMNAQSTLYWYPNAAPNQGGTGTWSGTGLQWSTTSGTTKTVSPTDPQNGDSVVFGGNSGTVTIGAYNTNALNDFRVDTSGYVFRVGSGGGHTIKLSTFSGSALSSAMILGTGNVSTNFEVSGNTAFTGSIAPGVGTFNIAKSGTGRLDLSSAGLGYTGATTFNGGGLWLSKAQVASGTSGGLVGALRFGAASNQGGTLTVIGDGGTSTFNRTLGTEILIGVTGSATDGTFGGFGARNGNLVVNFGGSSAVASWGNAGFRATTFILGTADSTHTVSLSNALSLTVDGRILQVQNGSAAIDAVISGSISTLAVGRILTKEGDGTLVLSGTTGSSIRLNQTAGTILIDGSWSSTVDNTNYGIQVASGATLGGDGLVSLSAAALNVSGILMAGRGEADESLTLSGAVNLLSNSTLAFALGSSAAERDYLIRTGGVWSFQSNQKVRLFDAGAIETTYTLITGLSGTVNVSGWQIVDSGGLVGTFSSDASNVYVTLSAIPEPSTLVLIVVATGLVLFRRRRAS